MSARPTETLTEVIEVGSGLAREVSDFCGQSPLACLQCGKCSAGCPVAARTGLTPHQLMRLLQTGQREAALSSRFIWECTSCHTCITRCPQKVDICTMNDALRALSLREGLVPKGTAAAVFNQAFLNDVRKRGRVHELGLMAVYKLRTLRLFEDMDKAPAMLLKGKLPLLGEHVAGRSERAGLFGRAAQVNKRRQAAQTGAAGARAQAAGQEKKS